MRGLPESVTRLVGQRVEWFEQRPVVVGGEASLKPSSDVGLVLGARWARTPDGKPVGGRDRIVQFLVERPDGTSRWTTAVNVP